MLGLGGAADLVREIAYAIPLPLYMPPTSFLKGGDPEARPHGRAGGLCATARVRRRRVGKDTRYPTHQPIRDTPSGSTIACHRDVGVNQIG